MSSVTAVNTNAEVPVDAQIASKAFPGNRALVTDNTELVSSIIIKVKPHAKGVVANEVRVGRVQALATKADSAFSFRRAMSGDSLVLNLPKPLTLREAKALSLTLATDADVEYAEPDVRMRAQGFTPTDPGFSKQWHLDSPSVSNFGGLNVPPVWAFGKGSTSVTVAVVDTGIRQHPDLGMLLPGYDFISDEKTATDGDGRDADATDTGDWNTAGECGVGSTAARSSWHGTHIAGIIAAQMNNGLGGTGVAPAVRILPVRVLGKCGGTVSDVIDGMRWAAGLSVPGVPNNTTPAQVINISLGASGTCSAAYSAAINEIRNAGKVVVVSTGNDAQQSIGQPANCAGVIAVTAHAEDGDNAEYSNVGQGTTISGPGGGCSTTARRNGGCSVGAAIYSLGNLGIQTPSADTYTTKTGTSMAAAHVSGVAALMFSVNPSLTPSQISAAITSSARAHPIGGVCSSAQGAQLVQCGAGLIDAYRAVDTVAGNPIVTVDRPTSIVTPGTRLTLQATVKPTVWHAINTRLWSADTNNPSLVTLENGTTDITSFSLTQKGRYLFTYTVTQDDNKTGQAVAEVIVNTPPVFESVNDVSALVNETVSIALRATDADSDKLVFSAPNIPPGAGLTQDGVVTWNANVSPGTYLFEVQVSDGVNAPKVMKFNVRVNAAPNPSKDGGGGGIDLLMLVLLATCLMLARNTGNKPQ